MKSSTERATGSEPSASQTQGAPRTVPTWEQIAELAYTIYRANGAQDGRALQDWLEAERRLTSRPVARDGVESLATEQYEDADLEERTPG